MFLNHFNLDPIDNFSRATAFGSMVNFSDFENLFAFIGAVFNNRTTLMSF